MTENMKKLLELISNNEEFKAKITKLNKEISDIEENKKDLIALAAEAGIVLTDEDFEGTKNSLSVEKISDDELESISGGRFSYDKWSGSIGDGDCFCLVAGGGASDAYQKDCACVLAGTGEFTELGLKMVKEGKAAFVGSAKAPVALVCAIGGNAPSGFWA